VLSFDDILQRDGIAISDVVCRHEHGPGECSEYGGPPAIVFVRRGCFVRRADGDQELLDPTLACTMIPGQELRYDHPHPGGDDCTYVTMTPELVAALWGGAPRLPAGTLPTPGAVDLEHRLLLAAARRGDDPDGVVERAITLSARVLEAADPHRVASGAPATSAARRRLADGAREALAADTNRSLPELAADLDTSPHHLSRVFSAAAGHTISRHRMRLRARVALERLAGGDDNLARLAADLGFADQSHLCRVVRDETGETPGALRSRLA